MADDQPTSMTLLQRAMDRDADAWRRVLDLYAPLVYYWCRHWGIQGSDADDIRQEVFQAVAAHLSKFSRSKEGESFRGWLKGVTRHKLLDFFRKQGHQPVALGGTDHYQRLLDVPGPDTSLPDPPPQEVANLYQRALQILHGEFGDRTWQAFVRTAVEGHAPADVAADLGMTAVAVRKAKSRVLRRLREEIGDS